MEGKRILEIGSDSTGNFLKIITSERKLKEAVGINITFEKDIISPKFQLKNENACSMSFPDNHFDIIASISVFEHIHDFELALKEMYRVLKPGGYVFAEFGPIWSSCWGHHLWLYHNGKVIDWNSTPIPPYAHLLLNSGELEEWLNRKGYEKELIEKIVNYVFKSNEQNRLFFDDYVNIVNNSKFKINYLVGHPDVPFSNNYKTTESSIIFENLRNKFPDKTGFGYHVITMLLTK